MYNINYVTTIIKQNKNELLIIKLLKVLNIVVQISIILLVLQTFNLYGKIKQCNENIEKIKIVVEDKRNQNYMSNIEQEWTKYYYKLLAVREMLSKRTCYGLMLKNFAEYIPVDTYISNLDFSNNVLNFDLQISKEKKKEYSSNIYKYVDELKIIFDKNPYFDKNSMEFTGTKEKKINDVLCNLVDVKMNYNATNKKG